MAGQCLSCLSSSSLVESGSCNAICSSSSRELHIFARTRAVPRRGEVVSSRGLLGRCARSRLVSALTCFYLSLPLCPRLCRLAILSLLLPLPFLQSSSLLRSFLHLLLLRLGCLPALDLFFLLFGISTTSFCHNGGGWHWRILGTSWSRLDSTQAPSSMPFSSLLVSCHHGSTLTLMSASP